MPSDWRPYIVKRGDYLTALAHRFGTTIEAVLAEPKNADFKKRRTNPEILAPLDIVYLPPSQPPSVDLAAQKQNDYAGKVPTINVHLVVRASDGTPIANEPVVTTPVLQDGPLTTDGEGLLSLKVPVTLRLVRVRLTKTRQQLNVLVGGLDPTDERSGLLARLRQMGCLRDERIQRLKRPWLPSEEEGASAREVSRGLGAFRAQQSARGRSLTSATERELAEALAREHGC